MQQQWADYRVFWREFRQTFHTTGAVLPSGRALSRALTRYVREPLVAEFLRNWDSAVSEKLPYGRRILEVGPGTGAVTAHVIRDMRPDDHLTLVERNDRFVARLRERIAQDKSFQPIAGRVELIHAGIEQLPEDQPYDLIISGLPLNNFPVVLVEQIAAKLCRLLAAHGTLSFFEYVAVRKVKALVSRRDERERLTRIGRLLDDVLRASEVKRDMVLVNVPPAWVHHVRFKQPPTDT
jgi:phosphatidylethanolamine/phosphatidyl-N-methylethanolamine N-methyltransferase